jgi:pimeloyl-ACP methyl ester carboxylesterase
MELFYRQLGEGKPLIILHGLFGSGDNWQTLARQYAEHFSVYLVDQRNHGHSPHSDVHTYEAMSQDLADFIANHGFTNANLLGHSMGGKTAMRFASEHGALIDKLIVADIAPKSYGVHHRELVDCLLSVNLAEASSRNEVENHLKGGIQEASTRQFFMKNLYWAEKNTLAWRFNLEVLSKNLEAISGEAGQQICLTDTLFIRGKKSNYIQDSDVEWLEHYFPNHQLHTIEGAGHWLHAEQPQRFFDATIGFLT